MAIDDGAPDGNGLGGGRSVLNDHRPSVSHCPPAAPSLSLRPKLEMWFAEKDGLMVPVRAAAKADPPIELDGLNPPGGIGGVGLLAGVDGFSKISFTLLRGGAGGGALADPPAGGAGGAARLGATGGLLFGSVPKRGGLAGGGPGTVRLGTGGGPFLGARGGGPGRGSSGDVGADGGFDRGGAGGGAPLAGAAGAAGREGAAGRGIGGEADFGNDGLGGSGAESTMKLVSIDFKYSFEPFER